MKKTLDIFRKGKDSRIAKHSIIPNDLDSTRSTLFGKFYEGIIAKWLQQHEGYRHQRGSKACVYWNDIENIKRGENEFVKTLNETLEGKKKENIRANLDGLFEKDGRYYLWEAKHWAKWDECKKIQDQVRDLLRYSPWILAKKVKHGGQSIDIGGILFSWWQKFEGYEKIEEEIRQIITLPFKFYFTAEIIDDCRRGKYDWYQKLINEQKENIDEFFKELQGTSWRKMICYQRLHIVNGHTARAMWATLEKPSVSLPRLRLGHITVGYLATVLRTSAQTLRLRYGFQIPASRYMPLVTQKYFWNW